MMMDQVGEGNRLTITANVVSTPSPTTERYYQQGPSLEAHHAYVNALFGKGKRL